MQHRGTTIFVVLLSVTLATATTAPVADDSSAPRIAVFDFELVDTSGEGVNAAQETRLRLASTELRRLLAERGGLHMVSVEPAQQRIQQAGHLHACNGCALPIARSLGADLAMLGTVHKVSTLILYITVQVTDVGTERLLHSSRVSIRGDNDKAWLRGVRYIVNNKL